MAPTHSQTRAKAIQEEKNHKRQTNFSKEEDLFLCRAFENVSQDPIKGNDRKGSTFWADVKIKFDAIFLEEAEDPDDHEDRTADGLMNRFKRTIHKDLQAFNKALKKVTLENRSGYSPQDVIDAAKELYEENNKKPFRFPHCVETLQKMPKYCVASNSETPEQDKKANVSVYSATGNNLERPIGAKAAKKRERQLKSEESLAAKKNKILEELAGSTKQLAMTLAKKERKEYLMNMVKLHQSLGDDEKVREYLEKLEAQEEADLHPVEHVAVAVVDGDGDADDDSSKGDDEEEETETPLKTPCKDDDDDDESNSD